MTIANLILATFLASGQSVSLDTGQMELNDFFRLMADIGNLNIVVHPAVQGKVDLRVKDVQLDQLLDTVMKNYGLRKEVIGNIIRIAPVSVFEAEYRQAAAAEAARLTALPLQTQIYFLNYARAEDMVQVVSRLLSPRGSVIAYRPRNAIIVRDVVR